jgi:Predicted membrane protein
MMKEVFKKSIQGGNVNLALLVVRISIAALMLTHGLPKLGKFFSDEPIVFASIFGMGPELSLTLAVFSEVVCSIFLLVGLGTRLASVPLIVTMAIAAFYVHAADPFGIKEKAVLYLVGYIVLFMAGGGKYSIDHLIGKRDSNALSV